MLKMGACRKVRLGRCREAKLQPVAADQSTLRRKADHAKLTDTHTHMQMRKGNHPTLNPVTENNVFYSDGGVN